MSCMHRNGPAHRNCPFSHWLGGMKCVNDNHVTKKYSTTQKYKVQRQQMQQESEENEMEKKDDGHPHKTLVVKRESAIANCS